MCVHWLNGTGPMPGCAECEWHLRHAGDCDRYRVYDEWGQPIVVTLISNAA